VHGAHTEREIVGERVLEVGSGRGLLAECLGRQFDVTACDIVEPSALVTSERLTFVEAPAEALPFEAASFDTVVCTHVLEHVRDIDAALAELRRVASRCVVIVVPRERPYRFGFNLHLSFFPYRYSVLNVIGKGSAAKAIQIDLEGGDWFYIEDLQLNSEES
jgi:ubiquinone/menaquinone biosynthesis C-methylase UbiE